MSSHEDRHDLPPVKLWWLLPALLVALAALAAGWMIEDPVWLSRLLRLAGQLVAILTPVGFLLWRYRKYRRASEAPGPER